MAPRATPDPAHAVAVVVASHLQRLVATQEWEVFVAHVAEAEQQHMKALVRAGAEEIRYLQGRIEGIREVLRLPELLIARARRQ